MKMVVWLWNPGARYADTRHNIGFVFVDQRSDALDLGKWKQESKYKAEVLMCAIGGEKVVLCKPQTYMNLSGFSVAGLANFYKIAAKDIVVLHDEIDFPVARIALKYGGSAAGHNGLKSIIEKLGTQEFWRIRIGVDRPSDPRSVADWVLSGFSKEEQWKLEYKRDEIFAAIEQFLQSKA